ncbi:unnamed protein product, partial [Prunus brigantina]
CSDSQHHPISISSVEIHDTHTSKQVSVRSGYVQSLTSRVWLNSRLQLLVRETRRGTQTPGPIDTSISILSQTHRPSGLPFSYCISLNLR